MNQKLERYFSKLGMIVVITAVTAIIIVGLLLYYRHAPVTHQLLGVIGLDGFVPRESLFAGKDMQYTYATSSQPDVQPGVCGCPYCCQQL